jgi:hypothetical protein
VQHTSQLWYATNVGAVQFDITAVQYVEHDGSMPAGHAFKHCSDTAESIPSTELHAMTTHVAIAQPAAIDRAPITMSP